MMKQKLWAVLLALSLCLGLRTTAMAAGPYSDVPADHWAYDAIMRVSDDSQYPATFNGTSATTFSPQGTITRGQLIAALNRSMNNDHWANLDGPVPYADVSADAYYCKAMIWAKEEGILPAWLIDQDRIYPNTPLTRGEFCVILRNFDRWDLGPNAQDIRNAMLGWGYHLYVLNGTSSTTMSPNALVTRPRPL